MVYVTRRVSFSSAHHLRNDGYDEEENKRIFGKCANTHGHNYELEVTLKGEIDHSTGYVFDLKVLKDILKREFVDIADHASLNDVPALKGLNPTAENVVVAVWRLIEGKMGNAKLHSVKLYETVNNIAEYRGE